MISWDRLGWLALGVALAGCAGSADVKVDLERTKAVAGDHWEELEAALASAPEAHREDLAFLLAQTGYRSFWPDWKSKVPDAGVIKADLLLGHVRLAHEARLLYPWAADLGEDTFRRFVLGYRMTTERLEDWRTPLWADTELRPLVDGFKQRFLEASTYDEKDRVFKEMLHRINTEWFRLHLTYAPRGMPDLGPLEAMGQKTGRCTDLTNTFIGILRTYGIAATGVRVVWWPDGESNHTWTAVYNPVTGEWLDIDSGQGGSPDDPSYFRRFVGAGGRKPAKIYWVVPGEEAGAVAQAIALEEGETYPPAIEKYLVAKPMVDKTDRYGDVTELKVDGVPANALIWLTVRNAGMWRPIGGVRSSPEGSVSFSKVGRGNRYRLLTWAGEMPAYCSEVLKVQTDGEVEIEPADPADEAALLEQQGLRWLQAGRLEEAKEVMIRSLKLRSENADTLYNLACVCSLLGEREEALDFLEQAVKAGWKNFAHMKTDKDLESIRDEERFLELLK